MALTMTRPTKRDDSATFQFKKRTPKALLSARKGERITLRLPDSQGGSATVTAKVGEAIKVLCARASQSLRSSDAQQSTRSLNASIARL